MINLTTIRNFITKTPFVRSIMTASASYWKTEHLNFYKINIGASETFEEFFGVPLPPTTEFDEPVSELLRCVHTHNTTEFVQPQSLKAFNVLRDIEKVVGPRKEEESSVDALSQSIFNLFDYIDYEIGPSPRRNLRLYMNNETKMAIPNTSLESRNEKLRLVQENKSYKVGLAGKLPEPQLIAQAIAALQFNYPERIPPSPHEFFPAIIMLGTQPTFYLIPKSQDLVDAVRTGTEPRNTTEVRKYTLFGSNEISPRAMLEPHVIEHIAACYIAFRRYTRLN